MASLSQHRLRRQVIRPGGKHKLSFPFILAFSSLCVLAPLFFVSTRLGVFIRSYVPPTSLESSSASLSSSTSKSSAVVINQQSEEQQNQHFQDKDDDPKLHIVISTDCSYYMKWQSYVFFYHAMEVKQPGHITQIASGCSEAEQQALTKHHEENVKIMSNNRFHLHFTPNASTVSKYFNKPIALHHWLEHVLGFPNNSDAHDDTIVVICDPDMILLKPFVNNFTSMSNDSWNEGAKQRPIRAFVERGFPIAQEYAYRDIWMEITKANMTSIVGEDSPVHNVSKFEATYYFPAGPPYVLAASDLYQLAKLWLNFSMVFHSFSPQAMSEMYGYSIAAAHLGLKHQLSLRFMIGGTENEAEGWSTSIDKIPPSEICGDVAPDRLPHVIHYCQQYAIGGYCFNKFPLYNSFLTCEGPLMFEPPKDAALQFNFSRFLNGRVKVWNDATQILRHSFMSCRVISGLNRAVTFYKKHRCGDTANYNQGWSYANQ